MVAYFSYSRWDGTQRLAIDADELLDQLADRLIDGEDPRWALQRLMREGFQRPDGDRMQGLREMLEKIRQARQERLQQHDMGKVVDELREALDRIRDMVRDLNKLLQQHRSGQNPDQTGATQEFLDKHGGFFPGAQNMQDILNQLAQQMNQMGSLMRSL